MTGSTFTLHRRTDPSGVSGTGVVAEGFESSSGKFVVLVWLSATPSVSIYGDIRDVERIHGHNGETVIVWDTPTQYTPYEPPTGASHPEWDDLLAGQTPPPPVANDNEPTTSLWEMHDDPEFN